MSNQQVIQPDDGRKEKVKQTTTMIDQIDARQGFPWGSLFLAVVSGIYLLNPLAGIDILPDFIPIAGNLDEVGASYLLFRSLAKIGWVTITK